MCRFYYKFMYRLGHAINEHLENAFLLCLSAIGIVLIAVVFVLIAVILFLIHWSVFTGVAVIAALWALGSYASNRENYFRYKMDE